MSPRPITNIAIIGAGTIGLSFAALHLIENLECNVKIYDVRADLAEYVADHLPKYLVDANEQSCMKRLQLAASLEEAVRSADVVQEQGPENEEFKRKLWPQVEALSPPHALFWSSTSGIPASLQSAGMVDRSRLVVVHPYNPPHIMPLLEVVRAPETNQSVIDHTLDYWRKLGRTPVVIQKECTGFVANRLAFALYREACSLVSQGIVSVKDLDDIVCASMGPRWTVSGPFKSYHAGGGEGGLAGFMDKIGGTVENCWNASQEDVRRQDIHVDAEWQAEICRQAAEAYGTVDTAERDRKTKRVLNAVAD